MRVQLVKKIMTLESMVESLRAELVELGSSDTLTRTKQQHESIVTGLRQKFDADILAAKEKIDLLTKRLAEKVTLLLIFAFIKPNLLRTGRHFGLFQRLLCLPCSFVSGLNHIFITRYEKKIANQAAFHTMW